MRFVYRSRGEALSDKPADYWAAQIEQDREGFRSWVAALNWENEALHKQWLNAQAMANKVEHEKVMLEVKYTCDMRSAESREEALRKRVEELVKSGVEGFNRGYDTAERQFAHRAIDAESCAEVLAIRLEELKQCAALELQKAESRAEALQQDVSLWASRAKEEVSRAEALQRRVEELEADHRVYNAINHPGHCFEDCAQCQTVARLVNHRHDHEIIKKVWIARERESIRRAESAEKERDEENRVNKQHSECLDARDRRIAELEQRLALYEAPFNEKELDDAIAWAKSAIVFAEAWAGGEPQKHGKVLASAVRSLRWKLDEAVKASESVLREHGCSIPESPEPCLMCTEVKESLARIRGGR